MKMIMAFLVFCISQSGLAQQSTLSEEGAHVVDQSRQLHQSLQALEQQTISSLEPRRQIQSLERSLLRVQSTMQSTGNPMVCVRDLLNAGLSSAESATLCQASGLDARLVGPCTQNLVRAGLQREQSARVCASQAMHAETIPSCVSYLVQMGVGRERSLEHCGKSFQPYELTRCYEGLERLGLDDSLALGLCTQEDRSVDQLPACARGMVNNGYSREDAATNCLATYDRANYPSCVYSLRNAGLYQEDATRFCTIRFEGITDTGIAACTRAMIAAGNDRQKSGEACFEGQRFATALPACFSDFRRLGLDHEGAIAACLRGQGNPQLVSCVQEGRRLGLTHAEALDVCAPDEDDATPPPPQDEGWLDVSDASACDLSAGPCAYTHNDFGYEISVPFLNVPYLQGQYRTSPNYCQTLTWNGHEDWELTDIYTLEDLVRKLRDGTLPALPEGIDISISYTSSTDDDTFGSGTHIDRYTMNLETGRKGRQLIEYGPFHDPTHVNVLCIRPKG